MRDRCHKPCFHLGKQVWPCQWGPSWQLWLISFEQRLLSCRVCVWAVSVVSVCGYNVQASQDHSSHCGNSCHGDGRIEKDSETVIHHRQCFLKWSCNTLWSDPCQRTFRKKKEKRKTYTTPISGLPTYVWTYAAGKNLAEVEDWYSWIALSQFRYTRLSNKKREKQGKSTGRKTTSGPFSEMAEHCSHIDTETDTRLNSHIHHPALLMTHPWMLLKRLMLRWRDLYLRVMLIVLLQHVHAQCVCVCVCV